MDDTAVVAVQIGRPLRSDADVVARCHLGLPVVTRVPPLLDDGTPFPTLYWLSCPLAMRRVGRVEAAGGVRSMDRRAAADPGFEASLQRAHRRYAAERDALIPADGQCVSESDPPMAPIRPLGREGSDIAPLFHRG